MKKTKSRVKKFWRAPRANFEFTLPFPLEIHDTATRRPFLIFKPKKTLKIFEWKKYYFGLRWGGILIMCKIYTPGFMSMRIDLIVRNSSMKYSFRISNFDLFWWFGFKPWLNFSVFQLFLGLVSERLFWLTPDFLLEHITLYCHLIL